jgi:hypothetical protein
VSGYTKLATEALERAEKATEGPWEIEWDQVDDETPWPAWLDGSKVGHLVTFEEASPEDAIFITAARTDVPTLAHAVLELVGMLRATDKALGVIYGNTEDEAVYALHLFVAQALKGDQ